MIKAGIIGATGYAGNEIVDFFLDTRTLRSNGSAPEAT